jgi:DHA2 family multidrug resistance protein
MAVTDASEATPAAGQPDAAVENFRRWMILASAVTATALFATSITITSIAMPHMQGALSATIDQIAWVLTFNIVATAVATPLTGWLSLRFGRRQVMLVAIGGFTIATVLCASANSLFEIVLWRIGQGLFGAPIIPLSQALLLAAFPRRQHATVISIWGMGVMIGPTLGPTLGGWLTDVASWRMVFIAVSPIGALSFVMAWIGIARSDGEPGKRMDWIGFLSLVVAVGATQLMLDRGERLDWFESGEIVVSGMLAALGFYVFVTHSLTSSAPFLDPRMLLDRNYTLGCLIMFIVGLLMFAPLALLPPMLQQLHGYPMTLIGMLLIPRGAGTFLGQMVIGRLGDRVDPRAILACSFICMGISGFGLQTMGMEVDTFTLIWTGLIQGVGVGCGWIGATLVTFSTLPQRWLDEGTAVFHLIRNIASSIGISVAVIVLTRSSKTSHAYLTEHVNPYNFLFWASETAGRYSIDSPRGLMAIERELARQAQMIGFINDFHLYGLVALCGLPVLLFLRLPPRGAVAAE